MIIKEITCIEWFNHFKHSGHYIPPALTSEFPTFCPSPSTYTIYGLCVVLTTKSNFLPNSKPGFLIEKN